MLTGDATMGLIHLKLTPPSSLQLQAALHPACHGHNRSHRGEGRLSLGIRQLSFLYGISNFIFPALCVAERRESCHRDTQEEGLSQGALSSQGSSKMRKLSRRRERKNRSPLLPLHCPAIKPNWPAKQENNSSLSPANHYKCKRTWSIIPQYQPQGTVLGSP